MPPWDACYETAACSGKSRTTLVSLVEKKIRKGAGFKPQSNPGILCGSQAFYHRAKSVLKCAIEEDPIGGIHKARLSGGASAYIWPT